VATLPTSITGREMISDPREPLAALAEFYRAFNGGDLALMELNWDIVGDPVMDNPLGGIMRGWPAIREVYVRIFGGPARVSVALHEAMLQHHGEVFVAIGRERGELVRGGEGFDSDDPHQPRVLLDRWTLASDPPPRLDGRRRPAGPLPALRRRPGRRCGRGRLNRAARAGPFASVAQAPGCFLTASTIAA
jgi:hypothetical protein